MSYKYAEKSVRDNLSGQVETLEATIANPVAWNEITEKDKLLAQRKTLKKTLEEVTPPELKGTEMDSVRKRVDQLSSAMVLGKKDYVCPMPDYNDMWKTPTGAEGRHMEHERFWQQHNLDPSGNIVRVPKDDHGRMLGQGLVEELKDKLRIVNQEREQYDDPDLANIEQFRPDRSHGQSLIDLPSMQFSMPRISYAEYIAQHPNFVPTYDAAKAGIYPGFALDGSNIVRTPDHPKFDELGPFCDPPKSNGSSAQAMKPEMAESVPPADSTIRHGSDEWMCKAAGLHKRCERKAVKDGSGLCWQHARRLKANA